MINKKILPGLFVIAFLAYGVWNSRSMVAGPKIDIFYPGNGASVQDQLIKISGQVANAAFLSLNGREIFVDDLGYFSEFIALSPGYNIVKISSQDRFGDIEEKLLHLYLKE